MHWRITDQQLIDILSLHNRTCNIIIKDQRESVAMDGLIIHDERDFSASFYAAGAICFLTMFMMFMCLWPYQQRHRFLLGTM